MTFIRWKDFDPASIEKAIQALIVEMHPGARPIDGRGGDKGRDVRWDSPDGLAIFEIKSHTSRLTDSNKAKIKKSLGNASLHHPIRWSLVLPLDHSPAEEEWFDDLDETYPKIALEWRGARWLDVEFGQRPYLRRMLESEAYHLHQLAQQFGHEQAALVGGMADVTARFGHLMAHANDLLSPFWVARTTITDNRIGVRYEERYPGAAELDPIIPRTEFLFPADDPLAVETERRLDDFEDYGGDVEVDGRYVTAFDLQTSEASRDLFNVFTAGITERLRFTSAPGELTELPVVQLVVVSGAGALKYRLALRLDPPTRGRRGVRVRGTDVTGTLTITIIINDPAHGGGHRADIALKGVAGKLPYAIKPGYEIFTHVTADDDQVELHINEHELLFDHSINQLLPEGRMCAQVITALDQLQAHTQNRFPIPDDLTYLNAQEIILAARLLTGEQARSGNTNLEIPIPHDNCTKI